MTIRLKVKTGQAQTKIEQILSVDQLATYKVWLKAAPEKGRANAELVVLIAEFFHTQSANVRILSGQSSSLKLVKIIK